MPGYSSPANTDVIAWTGLNRFILDQSDDAALQTLVGTLIPLAEAMTEPEVGATAMADAALTARQISLLQQAVAYHTAGAFILQPQLQEATGTETPLAMQPDMLERLGNQLHREGSIRSFYFLASRNGSDLSSRETRLALAALRGVG
jgi:hypothetical protein